VDKNGRLEWHPLDQKAAEHESSIARAIQDRLGQSQFARLNDLSIDQVDRYLR
jgi:hypothetical protein